MDFEGLAKASKALAGASAITRSEEFRRVSNLGDAIARSMRASSMLVDATALARSREVKGLSNLGTVFGRSVEASKALAGASAITRSEEFRRVSNLGDAIARSMRASSMLVDATALARSREVKGLSNLGTVFGRSVEASKALASASVIARSEEFRRVSNLGDAIARSMRASSMLVDATALARSREVKGLSNLGTVFGRSVEASKALASASVIARSQEFWREYRVGVTPLPGSSRRAETFKEKGIAGKIADGEIIFRRSDIFIEAIPKADQILANAGRLAAANEIREALHDISRKPKPDLTGAIQHAMCALECTAREVTGERSLTLGQLIPYLHLTPPLDAAVRKLWGYASEHARHIREGRSVIKDEAEFVVAVTSSLCVLLAARIRADD